MFYRSGSHVGFAHLQKDGIVFFRLQLSEMEICETFHVDKFYVKSIAEADDDIFNEAVRDTQPHFFHVQSFFDLDIFNTFYKVSLHRSVRSVRRDRWDDFRKSIFHLQQFVVQFVFFAFQMIRLIRIGLRRFVVVASSKRPFSVEMAVVLLRSLLVLRYIQLFSTSVTIIATAATAASVAAAAVAAAAAAAASSPTTFDSALNVVTKSTVAIPIFFMTIVCFRSFSMRFTV